MIKWLIAAFPARKVSMTPFKFWMINGIYIALLWIGGFFRYWGGAQIIEIALIVIMIFIGIALHKFQSEISGKTTTVKSAVWSSIGLVLLYWWGGFFDALLEKISNL